MTPEIIFKASIPLGDLKTVANVAKALNAEATLSFDGSADWPLRYWCRDGQMKCALVGYLDFQESDGAVNLRMPSKSLLEAIAAFQKEDTILVEVLEEKENQENPLTMTFTSAMGDKRTMTVQEAGKDDLPYEPKQKGGAWCPVDMAALGKVIQAYKRHADVVDVRLRSTTLEVSYANRRGRDSWHYATESKGEAAGKYNTALLNAAIQATKALSPQGRLVISPSGSLRFSAASETGACQVFIVNSQPIN